MSSFKKELKKVSILLGIGFFLFSLLIGKVASEYGLREALTDSGTLGYFIYITFYPVGVVYGWSKMKSVFSHITGSDRIGGLNHVGGNTIARSGLIMGCAVACAVVVAPVFGMFKAITKLAKLKRDEKELGKQQ